MKKQSLMGFVSAIGILFLILDTKTALAGAGEGLQVCLKTVIPALFPFFFLSGILISSMSLSHIGWIRKLSKLCGIPAGAEQFLMVGLIGGYPVGARSIASACEDGALEQNDANRMLFFCNNAGPSFIFGMIGSLFPSPAAPWIIWIIQILSAVLVGYLIPKEATSHYNNNTRKKVSLTNELNRALRAICSVCGWVIIFRTLLAFMEKWLFKLFPADIGILLTGLTELTNGCLGLYQVDDLCFRFLAVNLFCVTGGLCVALQTQAMIGKLNFRCYLKGKLLQTIISIPITLLFARVLFFNLSSKDYIACALFIALFAVILCIFKKLLVIGNKMMYNEAKTLQARTKLCCFERK